MICIALTIFTCKNLYNFEGQEKKKSQLLWLSRKFEISSGTERNQPLYQCETAGTNSGVRSSGLGNERREKRDDFLPPGRFGRADDESNISWQRHGDALALKAERAINKSDRRWCRSRHQERRLKETRRIPAFWISHIRTSCLFFFSWY